MSFEAVQPQDPPKSEVTVELQNISKKYKVYSSPIDRIKQKISRNDKKCYREVIALNNVSLTFGRGETIGIVGQNGSGKSTLLQLIAGTLTPNTGRISTAGRVAALLELGTGFDPEFSGHENIYLNGSLMGMKNSDIKNNYNSIIEFADIGEFIRQPVRTYSSGMLVRLAFAIATSSIPDILIIDEALAVGDERFQRKCFGRIRELQQRGTTIIFVSHSNQHIIDLCSVAILIDKGDVLACGPPKYIIANYQKLMYAETSKKDRIRAILLEANKSKQQIGSNAKERNRLSIASHQEVYTSSSNSLPTEQSTEPSAWFDPDLVPNETIDFYSIGATISNVTTKTLAGKPVNHLLQEETYIISFDADFSQSAEGVLFSIIIKTITGLHLGGKKTASNAFSEKAICVKKNAKMKIEFKFICRLNPGTYFINAAIIGDCNGEQTFMARSIDSAIFKVIDSGDGCSAGIVNLIESSNIVEI